LGRRVQRCGSGWLPTVRKSLANLAKLLDLLLERGDEHLRNVGLDLRQLAGRHGQRLGLHDEHGRTVRRAELHEVGTLRVVVLSLWRGPARDVLMQIGEIMLDPVVGAAGHLLAERLLQLPAPVAQGMVLPNDVELAFHQNHGRDAISVSAWCRRIHMRMVRSDALRGS
jgi:hypothetical protein